MVSCIVIYFFDNVLAVFEEIADFRG